MIAGAAGLLLALSVTVTCIPGGWKAVYAAFGLSEMGDKADGYPFSMHVLDVGKADAILIFCEGDAMAVDCGMADDGEQVALYLKKRGVKHLTYAVNTHPDSDHIGGFPTLLRRINTNLFLEPVLSESIKAGNDDRDEVLSVVKEKKVLHQALSAGEVLYLNGAEIRVLSPFGEQETANDSSLVLKITYGETSFLLMGDAEAEAEEALVRSGADLRCDVLKVGHHGSDTSTTEALLTAAAPKYAAVSVGEDRNQLPKDAVLKRLSEHHTEIYRTDLSGTLLFVSDGHTVQAMTEKEESE